MFWALYSIFLLVPMALLLLTGDGQRQLLLCFVSFTIGRGVLANLVTSVYGKVRPYQRYQFQPISSRWFSNPTLKPNSFPSKHVTSLVAISVVLLAFHPWAGIAGFALSVMTGMGRVVLGHHYVSDIIGGMVIGVLAAVLTYYIGYPFLFTQG